MGRKAGGVPLAAAYTPAISRRGGQVVVVSPVLFQAAFDCALSSTVAETLHPVCQGLLPGSRPFHQVPTEPPTQRLHRTVGLCRFCSGAQTLTCRAPARPRVSRSGDFPQRPAVAGSDHRQLPSTSWPKNDLAPGEKDSATAATAGERRPNNPRRVPRGMAGPPLPHTDTPHPRRARGPGLMPCLLLRKGQVCLPGPDGPVPARGPDGRTFDPFDVVDRLAENYSIVYIVDLDAIEREDPQLDYLQEIAREVSFWVDGGVRTAEQAIDILITGARRAVLSSAYLRGPRQLKRAWRLSEELVFEVEIDQSGQLVLADPGWGTADPVEFARTVRAAGPSHLIVSPREIDPDWNLVASVAADGPTWVNGSFDPRDLPALTAAHASGGIFHIDEFLRHWGERPLPTADLSNATTSTRDDEN